MDALGYFDAERYFELLCDTNRLAIDAGFKFCTCSGMESLQGPLDKFRTVGSFVCLDDTNDGSLTRNNGGGWFKRRTFTVFILRRYHFNDEEDRAAQLAVCRRLFNQLMSRMIVDANDMSNEMVYLHTETVLSRELGRYFMNGCTGLYFMIDMSEPVDLKYKADQWLS